MAKPTTNWPSSLPAQDRQDTDYGNKFDTT